MFNEVMKGKQKSYDIEDLAFKNKVEEMKKELKKETEDLIEYLKTRDITINLAIATLKMTAKELEDKCFEKKIDTL